jgi:hypothetical protein
MDQSLHPNLARLAASYDVILADWSAGRCNADQARLRMSQLEARDDQGVRWRLDPDDGEWRRMGLDGRWEHGVPPKWGLATASGWDLSGGVDPFADPRRRVVSRDVDVNHVTDRDSLSGATVRSSNYVADELGGRGQLWWIRVMLVALVVVVVIALVLSS